VPQAPVFLRPGINLRRAVGGSVLISWLMGTAGFAGTLELVSGADPGYLSATPSGASELSSLSADGRYIVFTSGAANVIPDQQDTNRGTPWRWTGTRRRGTVG